jgi:P4 family phage/plasmid primase-like protien
MRVEKGKECSHTSIGRPTASYNIPSGDLSEFVGLYSRAVLDGYNIHLTERHREVGPVVVDIDLRHDLVVASNSQQQQEDAGVVASPMRMYTPQDIHDLMLGYMKAMDKVLQLPTPGEQDCSEEDDVVVYVLEKPAPVVPEGRAYIKDGLHAVVPSVVTRPAVQYLIRRDVLKDADVMAVFDRLHSTNSINDAIDEAVICRNNWQMYGSRKPGQSAYTLTRKFRYHPSTQTLEPMSVMPACTEHEMHELVSALSIRNKPLETMSVRGARQAEVDAIEKSMRAKAAAISSSCQAVQAAAAAGVVGIGGGLEACGLGGSSSSVACDPFFTMQRNMCANEQEFRTVERLVDCLLPSRADAYNTWIRVGWCLRNIDWRLLPKWIDFSRRSTKFVEGECNAQWHKMRCTAAGGLGIGSLHMWAKLDNSTEYRSILADSVRQQLFDSMSGTHYDIARVVYLMFHHEYVCCSIKHKQWYEFHTHRWHNSDSAYTLRQKISTEVFRSYHNLAKECGDMAIASESDSGKKQWDDNQKKLKAIANKLKLCNFKDSVVKECAEMFYRERFEEQLDSKRHLVGFDNGVYDLDESEFRPGHPEDMISFSTNIDYVPYDPMHLCSLQIQDFLGKVFVNEQVRTYVLHVLSSFLHGSIKQERFHIWTGSGSNGKSCCVDLFEKAFGDYCCKFPVALLTQRRVAANAATSELARAKGKRFACLQEPSEDEKLNIGYMKELTGGDKIFARLIYKEPIEFKPQFKMILTCNHLPKVPSDDGGTWRRIRVVEFASRFVDNPTPGNPKEFHIDTSLTTRFSDWCPHFMALLLHVYKCNKGAPFVEPEPVMECTREYQRHNDIFTEFFDACLVPADGNRLDIDTVYEEFKYWLRCDNPNPQRVPRRREVQTYLAKKLPAAAANCTRNGALLSSITGYALRAATASPDPSCGSQPTG